MGMDTQEIAASGSAGTHTGLTLKDPVCGMDVSAQSPHWTLRADRKSYFCSAKCKAKFDADPALYDAGAALPAVPPVEPAATGTIYTCPMHPEIRLPNPG